MSGVIKLTIRLSNRRFLRQSCSTFPWLRAELLSVMKMSTLQNKFLRPKNAACRMSFVYSFSGEFHLQLCVSKREAIAIDEEQEGQHSCISGLRGIAHESHNSIALTEGVATTGQSCKTFLAANTLEVTVFFFFSRFRAILRDCLLGGGLLRSDQKARHNNLMYLLKQRKVCGVLTARNLLVTTGIDQ